MLERRKPLDLLFPLKGNAATREEGEQQETMTALDRVRAGVMLARDAVKAVSVTAMEAHVKVPHSSESLGKRTNWLIHSNTSTLQFGPTNRLKN